MQTIYEILESFPQQSLTQHEKGTRFERLMRAWLLSDPRYANLFDTVWLWEEFPARHDLGGSDTGIDLVAKTYAGDYWAIQCKCYAESVQIDKKAVDSFRATSSRVFTDPITHEADTPFAQRLWISTTNHWGKQAEEALQNQKPPVSRVNLHDLAESPVEWEKLLDGEVGTDALSPKKTLREHQSEALKAAHIWTPITPNEKHDWINQRDGLFDTLIPLAPDKKKDTISRSAFATNAPGVSTGRDSWVSDFSQDNITHNMQAMISLYNEQLGATDPLLDPQKISWTRALKRDHSKGVKHSFDPFTFVEYAYRPFTKQHLYYHRPFIESPGIFDQFFPTPDKKNLCICFSSAKSPTALITDKYPDLHYIGDTQCFPLYWYKEKTGGKELNLWGETASGGWTRKSGLSDWFVGQVRLQYHTKSITREEIFYYIYAILHSPSYRERFQDDLRKSLPRIPLLPRIEDFLAFSKVGQALAELHLHYEDQPVPEGVQVVRTEEEPADPEAQYAYYRVDKLRTPQGEKRGTIIYNRRITIEGIPEEAYQYIVNGKSAIEWIMDRYAVTTDKKSGITNDPNLWAREHHDPQYILRLLLSVIQVSLRTEELVASLPTLDFVSLEGEE